MKEKNTFLKQRLDLIAGVIAILFIMLIFFMDGLNSIQYQLIGYDEGYNATVAANLSRYGEYRVSYPEDIVFYNRITTGVPVLVPTAWLYSVFGVNNITSGIVSLVYGTLDIVLLWILFALALGKRKLQYSLSAIMTLAAVTADVYFDYNATHLIGESACLFFLLLCFILITLFYLKNTGIYLFLAGAALTGSFLTKSSMIFFVVTVCGVVLVEFLFTKRVSGKQTIGFFLGFILGFIVFDLIKYCYLGGINPYINWWKNEWKNMISQSSGIDMTYGIREKIECLTATFGNTGLISSIYLILPVVFYGTYVFYYVFRKRYLLSRRELGIVYAGLSGTSLLVYFILFGGKGLAYGRRLSVNVFLARAMSVFYFVIFVLYTWRNFRLFIKGKNSLRPMQYIKSVLLVCLSVVFIFISLPWSQVMTRIKACVTPKTEKDYEYQVMDVFLSEISALGDNAVLYCCGWWQEPDVTLVLDKKMVDINSVEKDQIDKENGYFIIGRRFDGQSTDQIKNKYELQLEEVDQIEVDYNLLWAANSYELFSIYKIS